MSLFFRSYPFLIPIVVWGIAQIVKLSIRLYDTTFDRRFLWSGGGLPSLHASFVSSLSTMVLILEGGSTILFAVTLVFSIIVLYDAMHIRFEAGKHAQYINKLTKHGKEDALNEYLGHTPFEVLIGCLLGVGFTLLFLFL